MVSLHLHEPAIGEVIHGIRRALPTATHVAEKKAPARQMAAGALAALRHTSTLEDAANRRGKVRALPCALEDPLVTGGANLRNPALQCGNRRGRHKRCSDRDDPRAALSG
jgi:hypothetical protein